MLNFIHDQPCSFHHRQYVLKDFDSNIMVLSNTHANLHINQTKSMPIRDCSSHCFVFLHCFG